MIERMFNNCRDFCWKVAIIILVFILGLGGCAHKPEVMLPVYIPCKTEMPEKPIFKFKPPYGDIFTGTRDLLGDNEMHKSYETALEAALRSCNAIN